jgi:UDP-N-acetylglucosamine 2-epimerase
MKVLTIFGTRPEAIKMAPLVRKLNEDKDISSVLCVTAQHRQMLDQVLELFDLVPDYDLDIMKENQTLSQITSGVLLRLEEVILKENPDIVLVHGDTTTTFAASLAAFYHRKKIGHIEAGLRTYDKYSPYPEEMNRVLTGHLADIHFAPTETNKNNLLKEAVPAETIFITGNTVIDALKWVVSQPYSFDDDTLKTIDFDNKKIITVTCHRRENLGENMENIFGAISDIVSTFSDVEVVYPVHMNPKVRETADKILKGIERVHLIEPLSYQPFANLMSKSYMIITDSGGMQEEAPSLGKPVLVVRKETERPEAVEAGTVKLAGIARKTIFEMAKNLLANEDEYKKMAKAINPYGDGFASERIVDILKKKI